MLGLPFLIVLVLIVRILLGVLLVIFFVTSTGFGRIGCSTRFGASTRGSCLGTFICLSTSARRGCLGTSIRLDTSTACLREELVNNFLLVFHFILLYPHVTH